MFVACKQTNELGSTPEIPKAPATYFSKLSACLEGSSSFSEISVNPFFPQVVLTGEVYQFSISVWLKMNSAEPSGYVVRMPSTFGMTPPAMYFYVKWEPNNKLVFFTNINPTSDALEATVSNPTTWHHVVVAYDLLSTPNRKAIYIDGVLANESNHFFAYTAGPTDKIQFSPSFEPLSSGCLDDIHFWHRKITASEVISLYNNGSPGPIESTLADVANSWVAETTDASNSLLDSVGNYNLSVTGSILYKKNAPDPFINPDKPVDPLEDGPIGENKGGSGSGSSPFEGGNDGYGGELGSGNSNPGNGFH